MYLIQAGNAATLAGITRHQLREWCGRRGIISPDMPGEGTGNHALYSWKTILIVRVIGELRARYRIKLSDWAKTAQTIRDRVEERSYLQLRGHYLEISGLEDVEIKSAAVLDARGGKLLVDLDPHLEALAVPLRIEESEYQLPLFPAMRHA